METEKNPGWHTHFFFKGTDSKYFSLCRAYGLCCNYSALLLYAKAELDNM
jgi:hypothetical protein